MFVAMEYDNLPIKLQVMKVENYPWHIHKDLQLIYITRGEIELKHVFATYHLKKGDIHIIHRDDIHGMKALTTDNQVIVLTFDVKYFSQYFPTLNNQIFSGRFGNSMRSYANQHQVNSCIFSIISAIHDNKPGYENVVTQLAKDLLEIMYTNFRSFTMNLYTKTMERHDAGDIAQIDRISRVLAYIYANYPYKLSLADIAEQENISTYYLSHLFQQMLGDSFRNFVSMARVEMSEAELLTTNNSISLISQHMGFSNAKYYVENFKYWFGSHPKEHRQKYTSQTIVYAPVQIEEIPLDRMLASLSGTGERSIFTGSGTQLRQASFDLKNADISLRFLSNEKEASKRQYDSYDPQQDCIEILERYLKSPGSDIPSRPLYDTIGSTDGLLTVNGLKKPIFWLQRLLRTLYNGIAQSSDWHLIAAKGSDLQILFFNRGNLPQDYEFSLFNMPGNYQITENRIRAENACNRFWKQLNYKPDLSESVRKQINTQTTPDFSYKDVTSSGTFIYTATLSPKEIVFVEITKL